MPPPVLVPYDPGWPARFEALRALIDATVGPDALRIDHIGSTSIPGLAAKDVVDIQVTVASLAVADMWPDALGRFRRRPHIDDHVPTGARAGADWQKRYWSSGDPAAHLHVREAGRANHRYALLFRDYLRLHGDAAEGYAREKLALAASCDDTSVYAEAKDPVCDRIARAAEAWATEVNWQPDRGGATGRTLFPTVLPPA